MNDTDEITEGRNTPVKSKAVLIDPGSMTVLWMNESASKDLPVSDSSPLAGVKIEQAVPMAKLLGLSEVLEAVARTGEAQHLRYSLIPSTKGIMSVVASIYCLPDGKLLLITELGWEGKRSNRGSSGPLRSGRRRFVLPSQ